MAKFLTAKFENREKVMARLNAVLPNTEKELAAAQLEAGRDLAERIRSRAPVKTGRYRAFDQADRLESRPKKGRNALVASRTTDKNAVGIYGEFMWRWLEFGTVKTRAQPHIMPTYRAMKKTIRRRMAKAVNQAVKKARAR